MPCVIDGNKELSSSIEDILEALRQQLYVLHIDKLKDIEYKQSNAVITCPSHKGGRESKPSCSVLLHDREVTNSKGRVEVIPAGTVHCFACGYSTNIVGLVADCLSVSREKAVEWLLNYSDYIIQYEEKDPIEELRDSLAMIDSPHEKDDEIKDNYDTLPEVTEQELRSYDYIHDYMFKRKLNMWAINKFEIGYDPLTNSLTFPVYQNGKCLFVARRNVSYKRFDMPSIHPKPIYGLDYIDPDKEVIVCESVLNAITCWMYGRQAVALFGTGSDEQIKVLNNIKNIKIVLCLDNDNAGINGTERIKKGLTHKFVTRLVVPIGKDVNDLTKEEFDSLEEIFI